MSLACVLVFALLAPLPSSALAATTRPYTGVSFGPDGVGGTESFSNLQSLAVDQASGDIYAYDSGEGGAVYKFDSGGEPLAFSALAGGSMITGVGGTGNGENEIAVAPAGSPGNTAGDIYVANNSIVKVFSSAGLELGTIGQGETCGVAVDPAGHLFIGSFSEQIREYVPRQNPPSNADLSKTGQANVGLCNVAADGVGNVYATNFEGGKIARLKGITDPGPTLIEPGAPTISVDPVSNDLYADRGGVVAVYGPDASILGTFGAGQISGSHGVAVSHGPDEAYVGDGAGKIKVFGPTVVTPDASTGEATQLTTVSARLTGSVNPLGITVEECFFEYGETSAYGQEAACEAPDAAELGSGIAPVSVHADIAGLTKLTSYHFRLVAGNANGKTITAADGSFETTDSVVTETPDPVGTDTATLRGTVYPEGLPYSECKFEYGIAGVNGFESETPCSPIAGAIPPGAASQAVSASLTGLQANTRYRVRLKATNPNGAVFGKALNFTTIGVPLITNVRAGDADQSSATLEADIDPQGSPTSYSFEWGSATSYDHSVPIAVGTPIGSGMAPVHVSVQIAGLAVASRYHYRVVANSGLGAAASPDETLETLDSCGLPEGRCFELVSPRDTGPVDLPAQHGGLAEMHVQAADRSGSLAYVSETGLPTATKGAEVLARSDRGPDGWVSTQLSPELTRQNEQSGGASVSSSYIALNEELSCGVVSSNQLLTHDDPAASAAVEGGGANLYRQNADGSYTAITRLAPENPEFGLGPIGSFNGSLSVFGMSNDCGTIVFSSHYRYPGVASVPGQGEQLYEWHEGSLQPLGFVPASGGGETLVSAYTGVKGAGPATTNFVSADGSRVFFSAKRQVGLNSAEVGTQGVFVSESSGNGDHTRDISLSQTSVPDTGATFQFATKDGSRAFFLAGTGLTPAGKGAESTCEPESGEGCNLYEYNLETNVLIDLSASEESGGGAVVGFIGASEDGSHVYFAARGELVPGRGRSFAENKVDGSYSIYGEENGKISYVGVIAEGRASREAVTVGTAQTSKVSADGRFLLFESTAVVTGYAPGGLAREAYLYDSGANADPTVCISCRPDGKPSLSLAENYRLGNSELVSRSPSTPRQLVVREGRPIVFFNSFDSLAPGAEEGANNVYEWAHGQVFLIATTPEGLEANLNSATGDRSNLQVVLSLGANKDGTDAYFFTPQTLNWEDGDERYSVYDARIGGGFPEPPPAASPCNADEEGSCQSSSASPPGIAGPASSAFAGPDNPKAQKCKKGFARKHGRCVKKHKKTNAKKHKKKSGKKSSKNKANHDLRTGK